jgi:hypothetical protein
MYRGEFGSKLTLLNASKTTLLFVVSLPLLITKLNVPDPVLEFVISNLTLSTYPESKAPEASNELELFMIIPLERVSKVNEDEATFK